MIGICILCRAIESIVGWQTWVANLAWFICNIALYFAARNVQAPVDTFGMGSDIHILSICQQWNTQQSSDHRLKDVTIIIS